MERPHRVLERKLHELEVRFTDLFFPSPADSINTSTDPAADQQSLSKEIEARVDFLNNLLSIEKECHPHGHSPSHLVKFQERLDGLSAAFRDWMDGGDVLKTEEPEDITECSCTRSCFSSEDDDKGGEEEIVKEEQKEKDPEEDDIDTADSDCFELEIKENPRVLDVKASDEEQIIIEGGQKETRKYHHPKYRHLSRILALVGAAAAVSVGVTVLISQVFGGFQDQVFLVPT